MTNRKLHDGMVGLVIAVTSWLGMTGDPRWLYIPIAVGALLFSSMFTGFCPVYFLLDKVRPGK